MNEVIEKEEINIKNMIYEIRGKQVMLDKEISATNDTTKNIRLNFF